jgi:hypothetical protein
MTLFNHGEMIDRAVSAARLEPVMIEHVRVCHFKRRPDEDGHRKLGCACCGRLKADRSHMGQPPSVNPLGSGDMRAYQDQKKRWQALLIDLLAASGLPRHLERVLVEGEATFPTRVRRDQGNHRFLIEKALGDALVEGRWLRDDSWDFYSFGNLEARYVKNESAIRLYLFPTLG